MDEDGWFERAARRLSLNRVDSLSEEEKRRRCFEQFVTGSSPNLTIGSGGVTSPSVFSKVKTSMSFRSTSSKGTASQASSLGRIDNISFTTPTTPTTPVTTGSDEVHDLDSANNADELRLLHVEYRRGRGKGRLGKTSRDVIRRLRSFVGPKNEREEKEQE